VSTSAGAAAATTADVNTTAAIATSAARWGARTTFGRGNGTPCRLEAIATIRGAPATVGRIVEDGTDAGADVADAESSQLAPRAHEGSPATVAPATSGLATERSRRLARVDELRDGGTEPYPYRFDRSHTLREVRDRWGSLEPGTETAEAVDVAGRLMLLRDSGKLVFATMRDRSGEIQLFVSKAAVGDAAFGDVKALDLGDWVGVHGTVMTTRKGELSVKVDRLELLAKALRPLPDKWHGLTDIDARYRQRYADLIVNEQARRAFEIRHELVASFRRTLAAEGFTEVETPILHVEAGGAHARPFVTHHHTLDMELYMRIALELHLKRLIVGGMERVYEMGRIFRNEGISPRHNPEFTMMELYQAFADVSDMMTITEHLIVEAAHDALGTTVVTIRRGEIDLAGPWPRHRMIDLVSDAVGTAVHPSQPIGDLQALADRHAVRHDSAWGQGRLIEGLFEATVEPGLVGPVFVTGHPVEISPLARVDRDDPFLTERFELFVDSTEIANGYSELNDPVEQRQRFDSEQAAREAGDVERGSVDEDYLRALEYGMPPTGGLGIGIDRLARLLASVDTIKEVILFPTLRPEMSD
jgi:lysyl-tRNA synthetase class 2